MTRNMANLDRGLRALVVAPAALIVAVVVGAGPVGGVLFAFAVVMLATAAVGFCPLYRLLHINTSGRTLLPH